MRERAAEDEVFRTNKDGFCFVAVKFEGVCGEAGSDQLVWKEAESGSVEAVQLG